MSDACAYLFGAIVYVPDFEEPDWDMYPDVDLMEVV